MFESKFDDTTSYTSPEETTSRHYYINYRVERDDQVVTPIIRRWCHTEQYFADWLDRWEVDFERQFIVEHGFVFLQGRYLRPAGFHEYIRVSYLLLSNQEAGFVDSCSDLLSKTHNGLAHFAKDVRPTKRTCGPALEVELADRSTRWLFPHPNGQRAAWEHLCNTTAEDDALRIRQLEQDIPST